MFQKVIVEIIQRVESLSQKKRSIIELDIINIKEEIQEAFFTINFSPDSFENNDFGYLEKYNTSPQAALGLFFLTFVTTLRQQLSYNSFWIGIVDAALEFEEDNNTFFVDHYFIDESEPNDFLNDAIIAAIKRFDLRDGYDNGKPTDTLLLQMGLLNRYKDINYWLSALSKNPIVAILTNRANENFSDTFFAGWKVLQRYTQGIVQREQTLHLLKNNIWFQDFDLEELLTAARKPLHTPLISTAEIEGNFYLDSLKYTNNRLQFVLNIDQLYILDLSLDRYDIYIDGIFATYLLKDTNTYILENPLTIEEPQNSTVMIEIKDSTSKVVAFEEYLLFDFNHDCLIFDTDGNWVNDINTKLDSTKTYSMLIDSDFDIDCDAKNIYEYFDGYVHLITNITHENNITVDDGEMYAFSLNFTQNIKTPAWLSHLELYATSDFLVFDAPLDYHLKYNKIAISARQVDELVDINQDAKIVRWTFAGGMVYDLENIQNFTCPLELSYETLLNRKNTLHIKVGDFIFTKQLNATIIEKTIKPKYRTFLKNNDHTLQFLQETKILTNHDLTNKQIIITSFHEDAILNPELKTQTIRDKSVIFQKITLNTFFKLAHYPYYAQELSTVKKIYDDIHWNTFCSVRYQGNIQHFEVETSIATLSKDTNLSDATLITFDTNYDLKSQTIKVSLENEFLVPKDLLGFCVVKDGKYIGSYFTQQELDIEIIFKSKEILQFLRFAYYPFSEYFNAIEYEKNRVQRERARILKKKEKRLLRECIKENPSLFLDAFMNDSFEIDDTVCTLHFDHSKTIMEQILFAIEFTQEECVAILHEIILKRWQEKMVEIPLFLLYLLNTVQKERYYEIFLDELQFAEKRPKDIDEEFFNRMIDALLSDHKINRFEKINIKTITQLENKDFYIAQAIQKLKSIESVQIQE